MGLRDWIGGQPASPSAPAMTDDQRAKANQVGIVYPAPPSQGFVDLPVANPMRRDPWTTAWSGQVPILDPGEALDLYANRLGSVDPMAIYRTQPAVRKVVGFVARNIASTPFKLYNRVSDEVRRTVGDAPLADLLRHPAPRVTPFRLWSEVVSDWLLWDRWALWKVPADNQAGLHLVRIPARRFRFVGDSMDRVEAVRVATYDTRTPFRDIDPDQFIYDFGYSPESAGGLTPMQTLAELLAESAESVTWRRQVWKRGARMSGWIERPLEAMELEGWDKRARDRFLADFHARHTGDHATDAGGVPLLEDGMTYKEGKGFATKDMGDLESRRLTGVEVASAFHIPPELVGAREGSFANVREFRQMLYRDALGPYFTPLKQALNLMLVPQFAGRRRWYVDTDLDGKLRGSFEERAALTSTAVGAPWLTRNEARAIDNRPPVDGGDELITPLNVIVGSQPSPQTPAGDGGDDNTEPSRSDPEPEGRRGRKAATIPDPTRDRLLFDFETDLRRFAKRQESAILSALGAKSVPPLSAAWDGDRWDTELAAVLFRNLLRVAELRASLTAALLDTLPDLERLAEIVTGRANGIAHGWNEHTYRELAEAVAEAEWKDQAAHVFQLAATSRAEGLAVTASTEISSVSAILAARDAGPVAKRWVVRSANPRPSHRALSGQTVPIDAAFSNGAQHPGAGNLPTNERARCTCDVELIREDT